MYGLSNAMIKTLRTTCSTLIVGCSQLIPSIQTPVFAAMLDQQVQDQMTRLNDTYERFTVDYEELRQLIMEMRSQIGVSYAPSN